MQVARLHPVTARLRAAAAIVQALPFVCMCSRSEAGTPQIFNPRTVPAMRCDKTRGGGMGVTATAFMEQRLQPHQGWEIGCMRCRCSGREFGDGLQLHSIWV